MTDFETPGPVEADWSDAISRVEEIIEDARNGRMFILVDHEDRENEGDLVIPAQWATPDAINFMATHGRGLICLAMTGERIERAGPAADVGRTIPRATRRPSPSRSRRARASPPASPPPTGRARSRWRSIRRRARPTSRRPAMSFRCAPSDGGVLVRAGHTEAAVDIARLAGLNPAGVICEIMNEDGTMARLPELVAFAQRHGLKIGTISDLIAYRRRNDNLVSVQKHEVITSEFGGEWDMRIYTDTDPRRRAYRADQGRHLRAPIRCWCGCMRWTRCSTSSGIGPRGRADEFRDAMQRGGGRGARRGRAAARHRDEARRAGRASRPRRCGNTGSARRSCRRSGSRS